MDPKPFDLPDDLASAYLALLCEREILQGERDLAVAQAANAQAMLSDSDALIAALELQIAKLRRELRGQRVNQHPNGTPYRRPKRALTQSR